MRNEGGYTIIEALAAIAILAVALIPLYGVGSDALMTSRHVAAIDRAALFTQSKLEALAIDTAPLPLHTDGQDDGLRWSVVANDVSGRSVWNRQVLQDVHVTVTWHDGLNAQSLTVTTRHLGRTEL